MEVCVLGNFLSVLDAVPLISHRNKHPKIIDRFLSLSTPPLAANSVFYIVFCQNWQSWDYAEHRCLQSFYFVLGFIIIIQYILGIFLSLIFSWLSRVNTNMVCTLRLLPMEIRHDSLHVSRLPWTTSNCPFYYFLFLHVMVSVCQSGFLFVQRKSYLQELISIQVLWLRFPRDLFSSFFLFSLSASDQLGVVADGQTALWAWPGPEPWRDGELTDVSRIKHAEQVSTLPPARPPSGRQSWCALIWHHLSVCLQPNGEAWWWWQTRDPLPSRPCGGAWALGDLHASRGGLAFPFPLTELCQHGIKNVIYLLLRGLCMSTVNLLTPMCCFFFFWYLPPAGWHSQHPVSAA